MTTLRIEHKISNYDAWKKAFDSDPVNRKKSGVKNYRILRPVDDDTLVLIDLDLENADQAEAMRTALLKLWVNLEGTLLFGAKINVLTIVESNAV